MRGESCHPSTSVLAGSKDNQPPDPTKRGSVFLSLRNLHETCCMIHSDIPWLINRPGAQFFKTQHPQDFQPFLRTYSFHITFFSAFHKNLSSGRRCSRRLGLLQLIVVCTNNRVGLILAEISLIGLGLDLGSASLMSVKASTWVNGETYTALHWSSVILRPSCSTRLLMAFQPVSLEANCTCRDTPKSAGLMIS